MTRAVAASLSALDVDYSLDLCVDEQFKALWHTLARSIISEEQFTLHFDVIDNKQRRSTDDMRFHAKFPFSRRVSEVSLKNYMALYDHIIVIEGTLTSHECSVRPYTKVQWEVANCLWHLEMIQNPMLCVILGLPCLEMCSGLLLISLTFSKKAMFRMQL